MTGRSQGTSRPEYQASNSLGRYTTRRATCTDERAGNAAWDGDADPLPTSSGTFSNWVTERGAVPASVPQWTSRPAWLDAIAAWAITDDGRRRLSARHVSMRLLMRVARALAYFADGRSGRNVAASNARVAQRAEVSPRSVTTVRTLLGQTGWAVEASRGYGAGDGRLRRPSIWHLVSRREPICDLPRTPTSRPKSHPRTNSPSAQARRKSPRTSMRRRGIGERRPRSMHTQRLAAHLAANCQGFQRAHPGRWCDVLERSHLRLQDWTGKQLVTAMNATMRERGWHWPDTIANHSGFFELPHRPAARIPGDRCAHPDPTSGAR